MTRKDLDVIAAGAGIKGLSASIALAPERHAMTVFEAATQIQKSEQEFKSPLNASRLLTIWGLGPNRGSGMPTPDQPNITVAGWPALVRNCHRQERSDVECPWLNALPDPWRHIVTDASCSRCRAHRAQRASSRGI
ncbi:hypothetical protein N7471_002739 [Penicillium samsonianum]|uniref:uncharacterized protein n=1 Tax=Penicillium samsonianum TaxID=1882272 RepID=UPI00254740DF|nr:uncharacterized protein N7471_002739 [Penicillium samsonianum]KAJ6143286.1 hypothetical protein N7471_002739 [Penicillium samsonianum]